MSFSIMNRSTGSRSLLETKIGMEEWGFRRAHPRNLQPFVSAGDDDCHTAQDRVDGFGGDVADRSAEDCLWFGGIRSGSKTCCTP